VPPEKNVSTLAFFRPLRLVRCFDPDFRPITLITRRIKVAAEDDIPRCKYSPARFSAVLSIMILGIDSADIERRACHAENHSLPLVR